MEDLYYYYNEYYKKIMTSKIKKSDKYCKTEKEAMQYFKKIEKEALNLFKKYKKEYKEFMKDKPYLINYVMKGDTHGIYEDYLSLNIEHKGFSFAFSMED